MKRKTITLTCHLWLLLITDEFCICPAALLEQHYTIQAPTTHYWCFSAAWQVYSNWGLVLLKILCLKRSRLTKADFTTLLVTQDVWNASVNVENICNSFRRWDICPFSRNTYLKDRFHPNLFSMCNTWIEEERKYLTAKKLNKMLNINEETKNASTVSISTEENNKVTEERKGDLLRISLLMRTLETW